MFSKVHLAAKVEKKSEKHVTMSKEKHLHKSHMHLIIINIKRTWRPTEAYHWAMANGADYLCTDKLL